ncbi:MAG TPA: hypothetical protein VIK89_12440 [Cytophagaceae bacterium]
MRWIYWVVLVLSFSWAACNEHNSNHENNRQVLENEEGLYHDLPLGEPGTEEDGYAPDAGEEEIYSKEEEAIEAKADTLINNVSKETEEVVD